MKNLVPHPKIRGLATLLAVIGTLVATDTVLMLVIWLIIIIPILSINHLLDKHLFFLIYIIFPLGLAQLIVWGLIIGAQPGAPIGSNPLQGVEFAGFISIRIILLTGIFQISLLSIPYEKIAYTFRCWGIKGNALIIVIGVFTIWPEIKMRAQQIITARYARGLIENSSLFTRIKQFPFVLRPLLTWTIRSSIQRAEMWQHRKLLDRINCSIKDETDYSILSDCFFLLISLIWIVYCFIVNLNNSTILSKLLT